MLSKNIGHKSHFSFRSSDSDCNLKIKRRNEKNSSCLPPHPLGVGKRKNPKSVLCRCNKNT